MAPQATVIFAGAVITGKGALKIVTGTVLEAVFPQRSVAVNVTVTVPPQGRAEFVIFDVTETDALQSVALAVAAQAVIALKFPQSKVWLAGV